MADNVIVVEFTPIDTLQSTDVLTLSGGTYVSGNRLDKLDDVIESDNLGGLPADNATLVYSAADDKYIVKELNLDGGTF